MKRAALLLALAMMFVGLIALGNWQIARRAWKLDLIARVEQQLQAPPVAAPGPATWATISRQDEYRKVQISGIFDHAHETCTQAVTVQGPGCWVMTPLQTSAGWWLLVNRGFVDSDRRASAQRAEGQIAGRVQIEGLLRLSEPGGGFLRRNNPSINRWTSRDVAAIAAARGIPAANAAPYFVDASESVVGGPVGGLTVVRFHNSHLVYAITWYVLAALALVAGVLIVRHKKQPEV